MAQPQLESASEPATRYHDIEAVPYDVRYYEGAELTLEQANWVAHVRAGFDANTGWMKFRDNFVLRRGRWQRRRQAVGANPAFQHHLPDHPRAADGGPLIVRDITPEKVRARVY